MNAGEIWVLKIPTKLDENLLPPIIVDDQDYTDCSEKDSSYSGMYPKSIQIREYYVPKPHGYLIVPYSKKGLMKNTGFYEFNSRETMTTWLKNNDNLSEVLMFTYPEFFI